MSNKDEQLQMPENPENQTVQSADAPEAAEQEKFSTAQQAGEAQYLYADFHTGADRRFGAG